MKEEELGLLSRWGGICNCLQILEKDDDHSFFTFIWAEQDVMGLIAAREI